MKTALFVIMSLPSHFYAGFNIGRQLQKRDYRVVFAGQPQMQLLVEKEGFVFRPLIYVTEARLSTPRVWLGLFLKSLLDTTFVRNRYRQFCREVFSFRELERELNPDLIAIDSRLSYYALLLHSSAKSIIINTKLSTYQSPGIYPLESVRLSKNSTIDRLMAAMGWIRFKHDYQLTALVRKIALLTYDETYFYRRLMKQQAGKTKAQKHLFDSFHPSLRTIPKVITYPRALEYGWKQPYPDEWYIEMPFERDETAYLTEEYQRILAVVLERKKAATDRQYIVYCSLGTLSGAQGSRAAIYLEKIIRALKNQSQIQLLIATGGMMVNTMGAETIYLLNRVPQLTLLRHCDLMITHGGLNSMTECLQVGVPMLAAPLIPRSDHCGNVARIEANGFGLGGDMLLDSPESIRAKVLRILHDPQYRNRVQAAHLQTQAEQEQLMDQLLTTALLKAD